MYRNASCSSLRASGARSFYDNTFGFWQMIHSVAEKANSRCKGPHRLPRRNRPQLTTKERDLCVGQDLTGVEQPSKASRNHAIFTGGKDIENDFEK